MASRRARTQLTVLLAIVSGLALVLPAHAQRRPARPTPGWWDRTAPTTSRYYRIRTDLPLAEARALATHLDTMYEEYSRGLAALEIREKELLDVYLFAKQGVFFVGPLGSGLALFTEHLSMRRVEQVVQHEGFHQFAFSRFGTNLPIWVNEGLAEFFGEAMVVDGRVIIGQANPRVLAVVRDAIEKETTIPFRQMLTMTGEQWNSRVRTGDATLQYHQAWSMVHFLVVADGQRYANAFDDYLKRLNNDVPSEQAFVAAFGSDIDAFEQTWKEFMNGATPGAFASAMERLEFLAEGMLELHRRGTYVQSVADLRKGLREIGFVYDVGGHGMRARLEAGDDELYTIPRDDLNGGQALFAMAEPKRRGRRPTVREQELEEANPTPWELGTTGLMPRDLRVEWRRDDKVNEWGYRIRLK
jgi:hypothetical protein